MNKPLLVVAALMVIGGLLLSGSVARAGDDGDNVVIDSPDGKLQAEPIGSYPQVDYRITQNDTGEVRFTTFSLEHGVNDAKTGCFSPDSRYFAAVYMYGHKGTFTWVGIWDVKTGTLIREKKCPGYVRDTAWIFR